MGIFGRRFSGRKTADRCAPQVDEKIENHGGHVLHCQETLDNYGGEVGAYLYGELAVWLRDQ